MKKFICILLASVVTGCGGATDTTRPKAQTYPIATNVAQFYTGVETTYELMRLLINIEDVNYVGRDRDDLNCVMVGIYPTASWRTVRPQVHIVIADYSRRPEWPTKMYCFCANPPPGAEVSSPHTYEGGLYCGHDLH